MATQWVSDNDLPDKPKNRRVAQLKGLPVSEMNDEEMIMVIRERLKAPFAMLVYTDEDGGIYFLGRWKNKIGRQTWGLLRIAWKQWLSSFKPVRRQQNVPSVAT